MSDDGGPDGPIDPWGRPMPARPSPPGAASPSAADWWGAPPRGGEGGAGPVPPVPRSSTPYQGPPTRDAGAVGALVLGIFSILCAGILGIAFGIGAIVTGALSRRRIRSSAGMLSGQGTATAGLVLGIVGLIVSTIAFVYVTFVNPDAVRDILDQLEATTTTAPR